MCGLSKREGAQKYAKEICRQIVDAVCTVGEEILRQGRKYRMASPMMAKTILVMMTGSALRKADFNVFVIKKEKSPFFHFNRRFALYLKSKNGSSSKQPN